MRQEDFWPEAAAPVLGGPGALQLPHVRRPRFLWANWASGVLMAVGLVAVLMTGLTGALMAGLAVYTCTQALSRRLPDRVDSILARQVALLFVVAAIIGALSLFSGWVVGFLSGQGEGPGLSALLLRMADILSRLREFLPHWMTERWPAPVDQVHVWGVRLLTEHAADLQDTGKGLAKGLARLLMGMVLGGTVAISQQRQSGRPGPLTLALARRMARLCRTFSQIVAAQIRISLLNTLFTGIFLGVLLPLMGHAIPFTKTLLLITFVAGLIPVAGNLISNTCITVIALSVSPGMALASLGYLMVIHKLEYFLNARIIGRQIHARAWELLGAMLILEALFGMAGLVAAPVCYAYLKKELVVHGWV